MNKTNPDFTVDVLSIYLTKEAKDARCKTLNAYNAHRRAKMDNVWIVKSTYNTYLAASLEEMSVYGLGNPDSMGGDDMKSITKTETIRLVGDFDGIQCDVCDELIEEDDWPTHTSRTCGKYNKQPKGDITP